MLSLSAFHSLSHSWSTALFFYVCLIASLLLKVREDAFSQREVLTEMSYCSQGVHIQNISFEMTITWNSQTCVVSHEVSTAVDAVMSQYVYDNEEEEQSKVSHRWSITLQWNTCHYSTGYLWDPMAQIQTYSSLFSTLGQYCFNFFDKNKLIIVQAWFGSCSKAAFPRAVS